MERSGGHFSTIDEYIAEAPEDLREALQALRQVIKEEAPGAEEAIKYAMPTFVLNGNLVHFAAYKTHIGFYPTPSPIESFAKDLARYKTSKGAIQFPIGEALPLDLVRRMVRFRVAENLAKKPARR